MPPVGFEPTISAGERPQTYALDRAATGTGIYNYIPETNYRYAPHNDVSVNDGPHIRRWSHNIIIYYNIYYCVTIAYSIQYSNMLYWFVA